jgi:E3 ubiquitin-protein ligase TRIP12
MAVLSYLDFFATGVQRVAVSTAANMCRSLPPDAAPLALDCVPNLVNLLQYQDITLVEHASVCLSRIADATKHSPQLTEAMCTSDLLQQVCMCVGCLRMTRSTVKGEGTGQLDLRRWWRHGGTGV